MLVYLHNKKGLVFLTAPMLNKYMSQPWKTSVIHQTFTCWFEWDLLQQTAYMFLKNIMTNMALISCQCLL